MKTLLLSILISLCIILSSVALLQNANALVPLIIITIPEGANDRNCGNMCLIPQNITVPRGAAVEWINKDLVPHTVVSGKLGDPNNGTLFDSGQIWMGKFFIHDFNDVGIYHYFDRSHPWDAGIIRVTDDNSKSLAEIMAEPVDISILESPLKQFKSGIYAQNIKCRQDFLLVIKSEDNSPACVKPQTAQNLVERGWAKEIASRTSTNTTLPASFELCNTPYELREGFVPALYMPANSLGKVCVNYSNPNNARNATLLIFDASSYQPEKSITTWAEPSVIPTGNSTIVYFVKTGNQTGFYGLTVFCVGMPLAVGYDNQSNITTNNFPWMKPFTTFHCPMLDYQFKVVGVSGIGIKYIPNQ